MSAIFTVIILAVYMYCVAIIFTQYREYFLIITLIFLSVNDLVFVPLNDWMNPGLLLLSKAWKEVFIFGVFTYALMSSRVDSVIKISKDTLRSALVVLVLSIFAIGVGLTRSSIFDAIQQWRRYFVPYLLAVSLSSSGIAVNISAKRLIRMLLIISVGMAIFSIYEFVVFSGDYRDLWYYNFVALAKESIQTESRLLQYQFVRGNQLRATGFFTSAIEYSLFNALSLIFSSVLIFTTRNLKNRIVLILVTLLLAAAQLTANVRIGWIVYFISIILIIQIHFFKIKSTFKLLATPILFLILSFALIIMRQADLDASSVGRLAQYASVPSDFRFWGYGLGRIINNGEVYKDSWYISVLMVFGVMSALYLWIIFEPVKYSLKIIRSGSNFFDPGGEYIFVLVTLSFLFSQIYVFGFHYSTGLSHLYVLLIFIFHIKYKWVRQFG